MDPLCCFRLRHRRSLSLPTRIPIAGFETLVVEAAVAVIVARNAFGLVAAFVAAVVVVVAQVAEAAESGLAADAVFEIGVVVE